jgi:hypothetical protein
MPYIREDQADIHVTVNGVTYGGSWRTFDGGDLSAATEKARPGGAVEVDVGGPASRSDITCTIELTDTVVGWHKALEHLVGEGAAKVGLTFVTGVARIPTGDTQTYIGTLKQASLPNMGGTGVGMYTIVVGANERAA